MHRLLAILLATTSLAMPLAFANANAGAKVYICATPQNTDLDQAGYEALAWVEIKAIGNHGETGPNTNILTYDTWDTTVIQKAKGMTDAGSPEIEVARIALDPGQVLLRAAALTNYNYAFKMVRNDAPTANAAPTILYNRGLVTGPRRPHGRNEDFDLEIFTLALQQLEIAVAAGAGGNPPVNTVLPAITGTATVGQILTLSNGTFTGDATITYQYRWYAGGVPIDGATANTFTLTSAQLGKIIQGRVQAFNASGSAIAFSNATAAVS
jgi:hypothetical protein